MKLAIMMRTIDQDGGLRVYVERLIESMLTIDRINRYLLLYRTPKWLGRFAEHRNAEEQLVRAPHKLLWDQVAVPYAAWRGGADVIFNPKFSVPLVSHCAVAMSLREPAWWAWREHYPGWNARFMRLTIPLYVRRSIALFPISEFVLSENRKYLSLDEDRVHVAYPAPDHQFCIIEDQARLDQSRRKYGLPEHFIFTAARVHHPGIEETKSFFPGKNVETTVRAFAMLRDHIPHELVVAGYRVREYLAHVGVEEEYLHNVRFLDFVDHEDMPVLYNLAELFVIASFYESYAHALVEAMACGCPVVASTMGACPEISGGGALLADPNSPADFAAQMQRMLQDDDLAAELRARGLARVREFSWERAARTVLERLTEAVQGATQGDKAKRISCGEGR